MRMVHPPSINENKCSDGEFYLQFKRVILLYIQVQGHMMFLLTFWFNIVQSKSDISLSTNWSNV